MANKFEKSLMNISKGFEHLFTGAGKIAVAAEPFVDIAFPALAPLYNAAANGAAAAVKAAQAAVVSTNTESQNLLAITVAVEPILLDYAKTAGLSTPTTATVLQYSQAIQASLKAVQPAATA